jgi:hypothetical protein
MPRDIEILAQKISEAFARELLEMLRSENALLTITRGRVSKHGDYRIPRPNERHRLSINGDLGSNQFLLTFLHEFAHLKTFKQYGNNIQGHGIEWKTIFSQILVEWVHKGAFSESVALEVLRYAQNPKASTMSDSRLLEAIQRADGQVDKRKEYLRDLAQGTYFFLNGSYFLKGAKRRTRYVCREISQNKEYLVHELAEVIKITEKL